MPIDSDTTILALDIGATKLAAGLVAVDGTILAQAEIPTLVEEGPDHSLQRLFSLGEGLWQDTGRPSLRAAGIACGGPLDSAAGRLLSPPNLPGWDEVPVVSMASGYFGIQAYLENDGNAGVLAERRFGAAQLVDNVVYLTVSSGVGGGVMLDGELYRGIDGNAFEIGHLCVKFDGIACKCGNVGCLEAYASGNELAARARAGLADGQASSLSAIPSISAREVAAAAAAGDGFARRLWTDATSALGTALVSIIHLFNPEQITVGGGVSQTGDLLMQPVIAWVDRHAFPHLRSQARVSLTPLKRNMGVLSAAAVALNRLEGDEVVTK